MVFGQILPKINFIIWFRKIESSQKEGKNASQEKKVTEDKVKERIERRKTGREGGKNRNPCRLINSVNMK